MNASELPFAAAGRSSARESLKSRSIRFLLNRLPAYRRAGGTIVFISDDLSRARVRVRHGWRTYGQKGATFGGSLYAAIDPCYVIMLQWRLGKSYAVWDRHAAIDFSRQARTSLYADIHCSDAELSAIRAEADAAGRTERVFRIELADRDGIVHMTCDKTVVVKRRTAS